MDLLRFLIILSVLIFVHELGHLLMALRQGIKVEKFALGFGPQLFGFTFRGIQCKLCLIPFGGYVKMAGDSRSESKGEPGDYYSKSPGQRAAVVFSGPFCNYILAILCLWIVYCIGFPQLRPVVGEVIPDQPAFHAGLQEGDEILAINGEPIRFWDDIISEIKNKEDLVEVHLLVKRDQEELEFTMAPEKKVSKDLFGRERTVSLIGIVASGDIVKERYNVFVAFGKSVVKILQLTWFTFRAIASLITGHLALREAVTGPIGIFHITSEAAKYGFDAVLHVVSMLSLALAIFNVLPIPVLDGGHLFLLGLEKVRKKPLSERVEGKINDIGFGFILILAVFIVINDLIRLQYWERLNDWLIQWSK